MALDLGFCCNKENFSDSVPNAHQHFFFLVMLGVFSDKVLLACSVAAGRREIKKQNKKTPTGNSFWFRWTSGLRGFITNPHKVPPLLSLLCLYPLYPILLLSLPSYNRATAFVVSSSTVTNWHAEFSSGTLNPGDQAYRESSFISPSLWKLFMFITWCMRWISTQRTNFPHLKSTTILQRK